MKNIINWTLGGFFRSIGRILSFIVIGGLIAFLLAKSGFKIPNWIMPLYVVKADTINYTYKKYRIQQYSLGQGNSWFSNVTDFGTSTALGTDQGVSMISARFGYSTKFNSGQTYRVVVESGWSPSSTIPNVALNVDHVNCYGSTSTSSWSADSTLISDCNFVGVSRVPNSNHVKYIIDIVPLQTIIGIQFNIYLGGTDAINSVNVYTKSTITTGEDITGAIDEQTIIIENEFEDITNIITENNENLINSITDSSITCSEKVPVMLNIKSPQKDKLLSSNGGTSALQGVYLSDYVFIDYEGYSIMPYFVDNINYYMCFYTGAYQFISCIKMYDYLEQDISIPFNAVYFRYNYSIRNSNTKFKVCYKNQDSSSDFLKDTDTSSDSDSLADYINNFSLSIEGPLSSIITLPINMLQNLITDYNDSSTHPNLCTTFQGKQICLPSGDILWKRTGCHDNLPFGCPNYSAFKTFFQMLCGGFIYWQLLKRLVKTAEKGLDPSESGVNLMRL